MIFFFLFSLLLNFNQPIHAVEISPPTPTDASDTPVDNENIQKLREVVQQKVKEKLASITSTTTGKRAYIGIINKIESNDITISHLDKQHQLTVDQDTIFIDSKRNKTTLDKIASGQAILAMGYLNESQILETKRLIIVGIESLEERKHTTIGKIVDISSSSPIFVLIPSNNKDTQYQIKTDKNTKILLKDKTELKLSDLQNGQKVIVIFSPTTENSKTYYAHKIIQLSSTTPDENTPTPENETDTSNSESE